MMQDYDLSDAVGSLTHYSSATGSLWGMYVVATFAASGFGISMGSRFTGDIALLLSIGFAAFAVGQYFFVLHHMGVQRTISADILRYLEKTKPDPADFVDSVKAICRPDNRMIPVTMTHLVIDTCVLLVVWKTAGFL